MREPALVQPAAGPAVTKDPAWRKREAELWRKLMDPRLSGPASWAAYKVWIEH